MINSLHLNNTDADLYIPDGSDVGEAIKRTTHLGIGAHQDDLEFMAMHGILQSFNKVDQWFSGITCTNGGGSARTGPFAGITDDEMVKIRMEEQREAARVGDYSFMAQLGYASLEVKETRKESFSKDLMALISAADAEVIYTHNPADKHATHIAVVTAVIQVLRSLPKSARPKTLIGCEGWRDLDWLPDHRKVVMDLSGNDELATRLNNIFKSQISGGKRYDVAVQGRRRANATFLDSHSVDQASSVCFGMDLTPLIEDDSLSIREYTTGLIEEFKADVENKLLGQ